MEHLHIKSRTKFGFTNRTSFLTPLVFFNHHPPKEKRKKKKKYLYACIYIYIYIYFFLIELIVRTYKRIPIHYDLLTPLSTF